MEIRKPLIFIKDLPKKLNRFYFNKSKLRLVVKNKAKKKKEFNPVTNFDKSFEKFIRLKIKKTFPLDGIIGEEFKDKISTNEYSWSIDPIDGTKAFVKRIPTWSNLIGLTYKTKSILGLANFPELNKYYFNNTKESYCFTNKKKIKLRCSKNNNLKTIKAVGSFHGNTKKKERIKLVKKLGKSLRLVSFDALSYCLLAEGKVDAVIETNLKPYDIIPLIPIIQKAGGIISNWRNKPAENGGDILATSNRNLHKKILKLLRPMKN